MKNYIASKLKKIPPKMRSSPDQSPDPTNDNDIIINSSFEEGLHGWNSSYGCTPYLCDASTVQGVHTHTGKHYFVVSGRSETWQGIEQEITNRVKPGVNYDVYAIVRIAGSSSNADVFATLKLEKRNSDTKYIQLGRCKASTDAWTRLHGKLHLGMVPDKVVFYMEGPPSGTDIHVDSVHIVPEEQKKPEGPVDSVHIVPEEQKKPEEFSGVIYNPNFDNGLQGWSGRCCRILPGDSANIQGIRSCSGKHYAVATGRSQSWNGIEQDITGRLTVNIMYDVRATVRIHGASKADVLATLYIRKDNMQEQYMTLGRINATSEDWSKLEGKFTIHSVPRQATIFLEGPPPGIDILVDNFNVFPAKKSDPSPPPSFENPMYGTNIVENTGFERGLSSWFALGSCTLKVESGAPKITPPSAKGSLKFHKGFTGNYIAVTGRKQGWEGPAQKITERIQLFLPYQVSAWVRVRGEFGQSIQSVDYKVNVALSVDGQWVTGGEVEVGSKEWKEVRGSFRLEKKPSEVFVYVQGPPAGVDIMLANLQIFSVDRGERFDFLRKQAEQVRKRRVILRVRNARKLPLHIKQMKSSFPIGTCINRSSLENKSYVDFFTRNFDFAVFENELKWTSTEPECGKHNYRASDELLKFCTEKNVPVRGHCVFWEVEDCVQPWVKNLNKKELRTAVENRIVDLVSRYRGKFQHYDVNNEMLHGDFYKSRLGEEIHAYMFRKIHEIDPSAKLFVNDYHVLDGRDVNSCPEKYVKHVQELVCKGAPVGGLGVQGHVGIPVGPIISGSLDKLAKLGYPIWITELDVSSSNEHVRGDDLEVVLREAFAHPTVEGVVLWGFWEGSSRSDGHLVDVDATVNAAGKRFQAVKREWLTEVSTVCDDGGRVEFHGYCGIYNVRIELPNGKHVIKSFEACGGGQGPLEIDISL